MIFFLSLRFFSFVFSLKTGNGFFNTSTSKNCKLFFHEIAEVLCILECSWFSETKYKNVHKVENYLRIQRNSIKSQILSKYKIFEKFLYLKYGGY